MRTMQRAAWMWEEAVQALEQAQRLQHRFCILLGAPSSQPVWEPPADIFETATEVLICVALPGVTAEALSISVTPSGLTLSAERRLPAVPSRLRIRQLEIPYGRFERHIELPPGEYVLAERRLADGCLELRLVKG